MSQMRKEAAGDYQIGIWCVRRDPGKGGKWLAVATGPGTLGDGSPHYYPTLKAAYLSLTGEPRGDTRTLVAERRSRAMGRLAR